MRNLLLATTFLFGSVSAAMSEGHLTEDYGWSGLYVSGHLGYGTVDTRALTVIPAGFFDLCCIASAGGVNHSADGVVGGIGIGYNFQMGQFVVGPEVTIAAADLSETTFSTFDDVYTTDLDMLLTAVLRAGYSWDHWLIYARGGYAGGNVSFSVVDTVGLTGVFADKQWHNGYVVGAGVERSFGSVSFGIEYNYIDLESQNHMSGPGFPAGIATVAVSPSDIHTIAARVAWKLDSIFGN